MPATDLERLVVQLDADIRSYERKLAKATGETQKRMREVESSFKRANGVIANFGSGLAKGVVAAFGVATIEQFGRAVRGVIGDAAKLVDLSNKIGIETGDLQRIQFGFSQAGVDAETVEASLSQWGRRIGEAHTQGGKLAELFRANNVSLTDGQGRLRSSVDLLAEMADLIRNAGSDQERLALAQIAFGKAGDDMVLALKDGAQGMRAFMREADAAGGVVEKELLLRASELDDKWDAMWRKFSIMGKAAIIEVASAFDSNLSKRTFDALAAPFQPGFNQPTIDDLLFPFGKPNPNLAKRGGRLGEPTSAERQAEFRALRDMWMRQFATTTKTVIPDFGGGGGGSSGGSRSKADLVDPWEDLREAAGGYRDELDAIISRQEEFGDAGRDVLGGFIYDLRQGTSAAEALSNALGRVADRLFDLALDGLFGGGSKPGGGLIGNFLASIFHSGGVVGQGGAARSVSSLAFAGAQRMHSGGVAGLKPDEVPAILQRGEVVLPKGVRPSGAGTYAPTFQIDARGAQIGVGDEIKRALTEYDRGRKARLAADLPDLRRRGAI